MPRTRRSPSPATSRSGPPSDLAPEVPGYRLGRPVGYGARGTVWSASAEPDAGAGEARCAVAVVPVGEGLRGALQRRRFAALVASSHPNLAAVTDVVDLPGACAIVSVRVDGPTLAVLRVSRAPLVLDEVASLLAPLAGALAHLHDLGVTHGDVSPANVVLTTGGHPVLLDLAGEVAFEAGTTGFCPPERVRGGPGTPAGDVWSLATTMTWLLGPADRDRARDVLAPALADEPGARCDARELAALSTRLGEPRAVVVPEASALAQGSLRARTMLAQTRPAARRGRGGRRSAGRRTVHAPGAASVRRRSRSRQAPRHRAEPGPARRWVAVGAVVAVGVALGLDLPGVLGRRAAEPPTTLAVGAAGPNDGSAAEGSATSRAGAPTTPAEAAAAGRAAQPGDATGAGGSAVEPTPGGPTSADGSTSARTSSVGGQAATSGDDAGTAAASPAQPSRPGTDGGAAAGASAAGRAGGTPQPAAAAPPRGTASGAGGGPATGASSPTTPGGAGSAGAAGAGGSAGAGGTADGEARRAVASAVRQLVAARDAAVNAGDERALRSLSVPGSPASRADAPLATALRNGARVAGLATSVRRVEVLESAPQRARVSVVTTQSAHRRTQPGSGSSEVPAQPERCAVLVVQPAERTVRLTDVAACGGTG